MAKLVNTGLVLAGTGSTGNDIYSVEPVLAHRGNTCLLFFAWIKLYIIELFVILFS